MTNQNANNSLYGIIVADNNSIDNTEEIIDFIRNFSQYKINYIIEKKQGISYVRNVNREETPTECPFYIDFASASKDWITNIRRIISKIKPNVLVNPIYLLNLDNM